MGIMLVSPKIRGWAPMREQFPLNRLLPAKIDRAIIDKKRIALSP